MLECGSFGSGLGEVHAVLLLDPAGHPLGFDREEGLPPVGYGEDGGDALYLVNIAPKLIKEVNAYLEGLDQGRFIVKVGGDFLDPTSLQPHSQD